MAVKKITHSINVNQIWVHVTCLECRNTFRTRMRGASGRKNCPFCGDGSFFFTIEPFHGGIQIEVKFMGADLKEQEYNLGSEDIEIDED